ncbi:protein-disulfide reductase DsbD [Bradyrhizobium betae]|uniref:Protein-disulfide reductase DsbD n=1 Tax=Bradyrhizobium betae TaxID=244734 RepID=A0A5P6NZ90_9BRAD|nr:protein-disulfide reductase DsbD [Bradyrhizobium betae]MCS3725319.1 thiol:disulfide interchange protein DsbD [Bradyrhizobium betae]QFI71360.1 protein-disulfide reductase DsbD [Bradyrhizobium betae]
MPGFQRLSIITLILLSSLATAGAGTPPPADQAFQLKVSRDDAELSLLWTIAPGSYLYRAMIGAKSATPPGALLAVRTTQGESKDDPDFGPQEVYRGSAKAEIASADLQGIREISVTYQGCAETYQICYPPVSKVIDLQTLAVKDRDAASSASPSFSFVDPPQDAAGGTGGGKPMTPPQGSNMDISSWVTLGGMLASFFGFGLLLSFSPCTFPLVPIFFGLMARSQEPLSFGRGLALAAIFVGASALAYAMLGAFAAWSGSGENLQILLQTPIALGMMSAVLVLLSLSMFGLFQIQLPAALVDRISGAASGSRRGPLAAAAVLGFGSALIAGPCVTPPLATALLYVARTGEVARGMAALFLFGIGMGVPLLVFGALGPRFLPKPGRWLVRVRHAFGFILLGVAISIFSRVLSQQTTLQLWGALATALSVYFGTEFLMAHTAWRFASMGLASSALLIGAVLLVGSAGDDNLGATRILDQFVTLEPGSGTPVRTIRSVTALEHELAAARTEGKPVVVDFSAEWCVECRAMDAMLRRPDVRERLQDFRMVRADVTTVDDASRDLMQRFEIVGPPTILLFAAENADPMTKIVGAIDANALLAKLSAVPSVD